MSESGYTVTTRPAGGSITMATCSDGFVHAFRVIRYKHPKGDSATIPAKAPACNADVELGSPSKDSNPVCRSCDVALQSWAQGGALQVIRD